MSERIEPALTPEEWIHLPLKYACLRDGAQGLDVNVERLDITTFGRASSDVATPETTRRSDDGT